MDASIDFTDSSAAPLAAFGREADQCRAYCGRAGSCDTVAVVEDRRRLWQKTRTQPSIDWEQE